MRASVFERDASFAARSQGYGLTMQQGTSALEALGIGSLPGVSSRAHWTFTPTGELLGAFGRALAAAPPALEGAPAAKRSKAHHSVHLPREVLRAALVGALSPGTIQWGSRLVGLSEDSSGAPDASGVAVAPWGPRVRLHFAGGASSVADVVVGADGIFSVTRGFKLGVGVRGGGGETGGFAPTQSGAAAAPTLSGAEAAPAPADPCPLVYLGVCVVLGRAPSEHPLLLDHVVQMLDGSTRIYTMPFTGGERAEVLEGEGGAPGTTVWRVSPVTMWQLSFPCTEAEAAALHAAGPRALKARALELCGLWHAPIPALLVATLESDITGYGCYDRNVIGAAVLRGGSGGVASSRVTLIGDALHPMSPFKGQGANQALLDALALSDALRAVAVRRGADLARGGGVPAAALGGCPSVPSDASIAAAPPGPVVTCSVCGAPSTGPGALRTLRRAAAAAAAAASAAAAAAAAAEAAAFASTDAPPATASAGAVATAADASVNATDLGTPSDVLLRYQCTNCARRAAVATGAAVPKKRQARKLHNAHGFAVVDGELRLLTQSECGDAGRLEREHKTLAFHARRGASGSAATEAAAASAAAAADPLAAALGACEAGILARVHAKVLQSRAVAAYLHSPAAAQPQNCPSAAAARAAAGMSLMGCQRKRAPVVDAHALDSAAAGASPVLAVAAALGEDPDALLYCTLTDADVARAREAAAMMLRGEAWHPQPGAAVAAL